MSFDQSKEYHLELTRYAPRSQSYKSHTCQNLSVFQLGATAARTWAYGLPMLSLQDHIDAAALVEAEDSEIFLMHGIKAKGPGCATHSRSCLP